MKKVVDWGGVGYLDEFEGGEGGDGVVGVLLCGFVDVLFDVFGVCVVVYKDFLYVVWGKEFEGIFDDWDVD